MVAGCLDDCKRAMFVTCESVKKRLLCVYSLFGSLVCLHQLIVTHISSVVLVFTIRVLYVLQQILTNDNVNLYRINASSSVF